MTDDPPPHPLLQFGYLKEREFKALQECKAAGLEQFGDLATALCRDNMPLFTVLFMGKKPVPYIPEVWEEARAAKQALIELPRSHSKSDTFAIGHPTHRISYASIGYGTDPRILMLQENNPQAEKTVTAVREALTSPNPLMQHAFGDLKKKAVKWTDRLLWMERETISKDPTLEGVGIGGAITGGHPTDIIGDDMTSFENSNTQHLRDKSWKWWGTTPRGMIDPGTNVFLLYTPKFPDDVHGRVKQGRTMKLISRPALNRWPEASDFEEVMSPEGDRRLWVRLTEKGLTELRALWPCPQGACPGPECAAGELPGIPLHRSTEYLIHAKMLEDPITFSSEMMLKFMSDSETPIKPHMMRYYSWDPDMVGKTVDGCPEPIVAFPDKKLITMATHGWDHAIGQKRKSDNTAYARAYRTDKNDVYFKVGAGKWSFGEVKEMMTSQYETDPIARPVAVVSEAINFQRAFGEEVLENGRSIVPIKQVTNAPEKMRALVESGLLSGMVNGKVYFDASDQDTIREFLSFTGQDRGIKDDRVDACRLAYGFIRDNIGKQARTYGTPSRRDVNNGRVTSRTYR